MNPSVNDTTNLQIGLTNTNEQFKIKKKGKNKYYITISQEFSISPNSYNLLLFDNNTKYSSKLNLLLYQNDIELSSEFDYLFKGEISLYKIYLNKAIFNEQITSIKLNDNEIAYETKAEKKYYILINNFKFEGNSTFIIEQKGKEKPINYNLYEINYSPKFFVIEKNKTSNITIDYGIDDESKNIVLKHENEIIRNDSCKPNENSIKCTYNVVIGETNKKYLIGYENSFDEKDFITVHPSLNFIDKCQKLDNINIKLEINNNLRESLKLYLNEIEFNSSTSKETNTSIFTFTKSNSLPVNDYNIFAQIDTEDKYNIGDNYKISIYTIREIDFTNKTLYTRNEQPLDIEFEEEINNDYIESIELKSKNSNESFKSSKCEIDLNNPKKLNCIFDLFNATPGNYNVYYNAKCIENKQLSKDNTTLTIENAKLNITIKSLENNWFKKDTEQQTIKISYEKIINNESSIDTVLLVNKDKSKNYTFNALQIDNNNISFNIFSSSDLEEGTYSIILKLNH
jgi:hypothetical protein